MPLSPILTPNSAVTLQDVHAQFEQWRKTRTVRALPDSLKVQVAALIGRYPYQLISKTLSMSYAQIKHCKLDQHPAPTADPLSTLDFIPIPSLSAAPSSSPPIAPLQPESLIDLKMHHPRGATLQMQLNQNQVLTLVQTFLEKP
jgi:hypothetical protein